VGARASLQETAENIQVQRPTSNVYVSITQRLTTFVLDNREALALERGDKDERFF